MTDEQIKPIREVAPDVLASIISAELSHFSENDEMNIILNLLLSAAQRRSINFGEILYAVVHIFGGEVTNTGTTPNEIKH